FAFGLIHGCGFASVLREAGVGTNGTSVVTPLVCFNLGVELGQLAIAAILLPLIWKLKPAFPMRWVLATSVNLIAVGSYFLSQRIFGPSVLADMFMLAGLALECLCFWIYMLVHCIRNENLGHGEKIAWTVIVIIFAVYGALIYAAFKRKNRETLRVDA